MIRPDEIIVDNFAGGGGASTGIEMGLGCHVDIAINHDPLAIEMHKINHPETKHYCESVWDVDPVEACAGRSVGLGWFSPDCKHFSRAKGSTPVEQKIRGLAWVVVRWAALVPMRKIHLENVEEFRSWGPLIEISPGEFKPDPEKKGETFDAFLKALTTGLESIHPAWDEIFDVLGDDFSHYQKIQDGLGYQVEFKVLSACDYGTPTTRKRLFLVARNDGEAINWPEITHGKKDSGLKPFKTAADIIDWSLPVKSIFNRKKPLAENTMKRIAKGLEKYVFNEEPFIIPSDMTGIAPFITECANASSQRNMPANEPLRTICAKVKGGHFALVSPVLIQYYGSTKPDDFRGHDVKELIKTLSTANRYGLVTSYMIKFRGSCIGSRTDEPVHTISAGGFHIGEVRAFLIKYYGTNVGQACDEPLQTVTTKHRFGLVTVKGEQYQIVDIGLRMLQPIELFLAMGFPSDYIISHDSNGKKISKASQVARCGNAVCPPQAKAVVKANATRLPLGQVS